MLLGCVPGAMFAGFLSDRFGRKRLLLLARSSTPCRAFSRPSRGRSNEFLAARFLSGLGIGASSMICPVYIAEIAPEKWRGRLGTLFQLAIVVGIFLALFVNKLVQGHGQTSAWNTDAGAGGGCWGWRRSPP